MCIQESALVVKIYLACICLWLFLAKSVFLILSYCSVSEIKLSFSNQAQLFPHQLFSLKNFLCIFTCDIAQIHICEQLVFSIYYMTRAQNVLIKLMHKKYLGSTSQIRNWRRLLCTQQVISGTAFQKRYVANISPKSNLHCGII